MKLSARNQLKVKINNIVLGAVNAQVELELPNSCKLVSIITKASVENLNLTVGKDAIAVFKASEVMLAAQKLDISARNQIEGTVRQVSEGAVNSEIILSIGGGQEICSVITKDSAEKLAFTKGQKCFAIIKSSSVMIGV